MWKHGIVLMAAITMAAVNPVAAQVQFYGRPGAQGMDAGATT
jgi:hypothetical protein